MSSVWKVREADVLAKRGGSWVLVAVTAHDLTEGIKSAPEAAEPLADIRMRRAYVEHNNCGGE